MLEISQKDIDRSKLITPGYYQIRVDKHSEALSSKGDSTNFILEGTILCNDDNGSTEFQGVPAPYWNFNSKAPGFAVGFLTALKGGEEIRPGRFDLSAAVGKVVAAEIKNELFEGRMVNRITHTYRVPRYVAA